MVENIELVGQWESGKVRQWDSNLLSADRYLLTDSLPTGGDSLVG